MVSTPRAYAGKLRIGRFDNKVEGVVGGKHDKGVAAHISSTHHFAFNVYTKVIYINNSMRIAGN